jgi:dihydrofolate reductase
MRKVIVSEFVSLDGVMQAPGHLDEDRDGGFEHGGWQMPYFDAVMGTAVDKGLRTAGGLLLGRRTYEHFAGYWPTAPEDQEPELMNDLPKFVASTTLEEPLTWSNSTLLKGDVAEEVTKLKDRSGGDLLVLGSGELAQTLIRDNLVDEYRLMVHPVVLGTGKRLFRDGDSRKPLRLDDSTTTGTGVLLLTYLPEEGGGVDKR